MQTRRKTAKQPSAQTPTPSRFALQKCPAEIWGRICSMACVDNGFTGRSLSEVSRYIKDVSIPYKYQCIAVDCKRIRRLTAVLKKLPPNSRLVRHLFVWSSETWGDGRFFETDKNQLLIIVAPTLLSLDVSFDYVCIALTFPLPSLVDLTVHGNMSMTKLTKRTLACYPSLRRLHWAASSGCPPGAGFLALVQKTAPHVTHLRISLSTQRWMSHQPVIRELELFYGILKPVGVARTRLSSIQKLLFRPRFTDSRWRQFADAADHQFVLLNPRMAPQVDTQAEIAQKSWLAARAGTIDCWNPDDNELYLW
jgi:hypothetical protein